jgi:hypothetical protein
MDEIKEKINDATYKTITQDGDEEPSHFDFYEKKYLKKQRVWVRNEVKKASCAE